MSEFDNNATQSATTSSAAGKHFAKLIDPAASPEPAPAAAPMPFTVEPERKKRRWPVVLVVLLLLALGGAYAGGAVYFADTFLPNTKLNGEDVSLKKIDEVAKAHEDSASSFGVIVTGDGLDLTLSAADVDARYDGALFAQSAIAQQDRWSWPLGALESHDLTVESRLSYDEEKLDAQVGDAVDAVNKDAKKPKDAKITFDEKKGRYKVKKEEPGTVVDKDLVLEAVHAALGDPKGTIEVELGEDLLVKPEVTSDDKQLNETVDTANSYLEATQDLVLHDEVVATVDEDRLKNWVKIADDYTMSFDDDACVKWAQGELSEQLDTVGSKRTFERPDGKSITVSGGTYGWIINGAEVAAKIAENVRAGKQGTVEVTFRQTAEKWNPGGKEWGDKYIDIDLSEQHVRYYDGSDIILESDCVTGGLDNRGEMHFTPSGVYTINSNMRSGNIKLTGKIDPATKQPIYISYVDYWMPFVDDSVALHDATWRSSFGGSIYQSNGSHGCVNLPVDVARELYDKVSVGTVVVVHD